MTVTHQISQRGISRRETDGIKYSILHYVILQTDHHTDITVTDPSSVKMNYNIDSPFIQPTHFMDSFI